jgi:hypothetical protein
VELTLTPDRLQCLPGSGSFGGNTDYVNFDHGQAGDLLDVARVALDGYLQPGDALRQVGYPEASQPEVGIVREGRLVIVGDFVRTKDGGFLLIGETGCSEAPPKG